MIAQREKKVGPPPLSAGARGERKAASLGTIGTLLHHPARSTNQATTKGR
ncbi:hypothetical protein BH23BAC4_BH23BAC4_15720 [soil metagenome]